MKAKKFFWTFIALLLFAAVAIRIYYNVTTIGLKLRETSLYVEIAFYIVSALLFYFLLLEPFIAVLRAPPYSVASVLENKKTKYSFLAYLANNLIKSQVLTQAEVDALGEIMKTSGVGKKMRLANKLYVIYHNTVKAKIQSYVEDISKSTLYCTAVSQSGFIDMLTVLVNNFRMVKKIVQMCGFRPRFIRVCKLYINIFASSLIAEGAQKINISALFGTGIGNGLRLIADSAANGILNAFFMLRTGFLCQDYIYSSEIKQKKQALREASIVRAGASLPKLITAVVTDPIKNLGKVLFRPSKPTDDEDEDIEIDLTQKWTRKKI